METVNLLILDYDGTLADCKELHQQAFRKACMKVNNAIRYTDEEVEGMPTFVKIDYLKAKGYQFDETLLMDLKQEYTMNDISKYVKFDQELKDIFVRLSKKYRLAVCSNATRKFVDKSLAIQKLDINSQILSLKLFKSNRDLGLILSLFAFIDLYFRF